MLTRSRSSNTSRLVEWFRDTRRALVKPRLNEERLNEKGTWCDPMEREWEREGEGRRSEKCTRPNRAGYRCISDDAFQEFRARSTLEEFFFPLLVSPPLLLRRRPAPLPLARSLARQASDPKQCSHSSSTSTTTAPLFHRESTRSTRNYSIRGRDSSRFWGNVKIICRKEVVRKIRKGSRWIKFFFFSDFLVWGFNFLENNVAFFYSNLLYLVNGVNKNISRYKWKD